jgi:hypothetical protein
MELNVIFKHNTLERKKFIYGLLSFITYMKSLVYFIALTFLSGCVFDKEFEYKQYEEKIVVNGMLTPDSLITIAISKTLPYPSGNNAFPPVKDAVPHVFEDGILLGEMQQTNQPGIYRLSHYPKAGSTYRLEVSIDKHPVITASTSIPAHTLINVCRQESQGVKQYRTSFGADVHFPTLPHSSSFWLSLHIGNYLVVGNAVDTTTIVTSKVLHYSFSNRLDNFNASTDEGDTEFLLFSRVNKPTEEIQDALIHLYYYTSSWTSSGNNNPDKEKPVEAFVDILEGSTEFDNYMKFFLIDYPAKTRNLFDDVPNPFAEKIVSYSNVSNGTGIFAGYNHQRLPFFNKLCQ